MAWPLESISKVRVILYADDLVIFCTSQPAMQRVITKFEHTFERFGLRVARDKTETLEYGKLNGEPSIVQLGDAKIKNVATFRYLGHMICADPKTDTIGHKIGSAWQSWSSLKHVFLDREIPLRIRVSILESTVRARLTYALQARLLTARENARIESIWAGNIENDEPFNWALKLTNAKLLEIAKTTSISAYIEKQHYKFIAHTCRRPND